MPRNFDKIARDLDRHPTSQSQVRGDASAFIRFARFDVMITPVVLIVLYWLAVAAAVIGGVVLIVLGQRSYDAQFAYVLSGLLAIVAGPFVLRVLLESALVPFRILEALRGPDGSR